MKQSLILAAVFAATANAAVPSLTPDNYDELTAGKTVFVKFFAPWCGHCKKMAPDWEKLSDEWKDHDIGMVAEVDCTAEGKPLCDANGVRGFPSLKWGDPAGLEDYEGSRSYSDLAEFAKANLKPVCSAANIDLCEPDKKKKLEEYMKLSLDELNTKIKAEEEKLEKAEEDFKEAVSKLQAEYQKLSEEKDVAISAVKDAGLSLMKSVYTAKSKATKDEL